MANDFWSSPIYRLVQMMKASRRGHGVVQQWKELVEIWTLDHAGTADGKAIAAWLPYWHVRPIYTAAELAPMVAPLCLAFELAPHLIPQRSPARLSNELRLARLPWLNQQFGGAVALYPNPVTGQRDRYFIVENFGHWAHNYVTEDEFRGQFQ